MLNRLLYEIYITDIKYIMTAIPVLVLVWSVIGVVIYKKVRIASSVLIVLSAAIILYATVIKRTQENLGFDLIPFSSFQRAVEQPEMYRSMLMNVFLFVPLGMSLVFVFSGSALKRILLTVLVGFLLSVTVETVQYLYSLGMTETDDVICNTFGALIGSMAFPLSLLWRGLLRKIRKGNSDGQGT